MDIKDIQVGDIVKVWDRDASYSNLEGKVLSVNLAAPWASVKVSLTGVLWDLDFSPLELEPVTSSVPTVAYPPPTHSPCIPSGIALSILGSGFFGSEPTSYSDWAARYPLKDTHTCEMVEYIGFTDRFMNCKTCGKKA